MALRETESLGVAQLLVARKRQELDLRLLREQVQKGEATDGARRDRALQQMDEASRCSTAIALPHPTPATVIARFMRATQGRVAGVTQRSTPSAGMTAEGWG